MLVMVSRYASNISSAPGQKPARGFSLRGLTEIKSWLEAKLGTELAPGWSPLSRPKASSGAPRRTPICTAPSLRLCSRKRRQSPQIQSEGRPTCRDDGPRTGLLKRRIRARIRMQDCSNRDGSESIAAVDAWRPCRPARGTSLVFSCSTSLRASGLPDARAKAGGGYVRP